MDLQKHLRQFSQSPLCSHEDRRGKKGGTRFCYCSYSNKSRFRSHLVSVFNLVYFTGLTTGELSSMKFYRVNIWVLKIQEQIECLENWIWNKQPQYSKFNVPIQIKNLKSTFIHSFIFHIFKPSISLTFILILTTASPWWTFFIPITWVKSLFQFCLWDFATILVISILAILKGIMDFISISNNFLKGFFCCWSF